MKSYRKFFLAAILIFCVLFIAKNSFSYEKYEKEFNCFSIIVGKQASADGSVLVAHNEDDHGPQLVNYYKVPRIKHALGETVICETGAAIPQVAESNSYFWLEMPGMEFSDSYINEWGVVIASNECDSREKKGELTDGGVKYWLRRLVAERSHSAKEGVKIAGQFIQKFGYASSGRTYIIADADEGWMFAAVSGKHWVAQRVLDDMVAVVPNYYTIGEVDLADTGKFLGSPDLIDYAIQQRWYDPNRDGKFNFAKVYSSPGNLKSPGNIHRMWRGVNLLADLTFALDNEFPFAFKPKKKVTVQELMAVLRDHYIGTQLDKTNGYKLGNPYKLNGSTICASSTQYGFVAQLRNWLPVEIGAVLWLAPHRPDSQAFIPLYLGIENMPDGYAYGDFQAALDQHFNPPKNIYEKTDTHAFWAFVNLAEWVDEDYGLRIKKIQEKWNGIESAVFNNQKDFENKVLKIHQENPLKTKKLLTDYTGEYAARIWQIAKDLR
jgi:dipeptidase